MEFSFHWVANYFAAVMSKCMSCVSARSTVITLKDMVKFNALKTSASFSEKAKKIDSNYDLMLFICPSIYWIWVKF